MAIPKPHRSRQIYHFTSLYNLPEILEYGLLATNEKKRLKLSHKVIAYRDIQDRRSHMKVPCGPQGVVHDYVPFYFCKRSPMLLAIVTNKIEDEQFIIYLEFPITIMDKYPCVFTSASANTSIAPNFYDEPDDLDKINWDAVETWRWGQKHDVPGQSPVKQAKMAELLVYKRIDLTEISRITVWNQGIADNVKEIYESKGLTIPLIDFGSKEYYYIEDKRPPVTGPYFISVRYKEILNEVLENIGKTSSPKFNSLYALRDALLEELTCIPETADIVGLESDNEMHPEDVGKHTLKVVDALRKLTEYKGMNPTDKLLVEVSAFLHDIGKGPKSRWKDKGGRQQVDPDHPIKALPMVQRILTEDVGTINRRSAKVICKLVCYHDLVGDIVGKGRRVEELEEIVEDERELDMIIALGKADMISVEPIWQIMYGQAIVKLRESVITKLESID